MIKFVKICDACGEEIKGKQNTIHINLGIMNIIDDLKIQETKNKKTIEEIYDNEIFGRFDLCEKCTKNLIEKLKNRN